MKNLKYLLIASIFFLGSCVNDDDANVEPDTGMDDNEEELITTVNLILKDTTGLVLDTISFNDPDGEGGNAPTIDTIYLMNNTDYKVSLEFQDASDPNDIEDITAEIREEDDEHLICFETINLSDLTIQRTDSDGTYEVGLESNWSKANVTSLVEQGVKLSLKHQPGSKDGTCNVGDTDIEITFPVVVR